MVRRGQGPSRGGPRQGVSGKIWGLALVTVLGGARSRIGDVWVFLIFVIWYDGHDFSFCKLLIED